MTPYRAFGLGVGAINFNAYNQYVLNNYQQNWISSNDTNILNNINNYNQVYQYNGATFGNNVHYYYNPINGENSNYCVQFQQR